MKRISLILVVIGIAIMAAAWMLCKNGDKPTLYHWSHTLGGKGYDGASAICVDGEVNVYIVGDFTGSVDFKNNWNGKDIRKSNGVTDIFITKIEENGNYSWTHRIGGQDIDRACAVCTDPDGNVYLAGWFKSATLDFAEDWGKHDVKTRSGISDGFVTKIGSDGVYCWTRRIGGLNKHWAHSLIIGMGDSISSLCSDSKGNIYIAGEFRGEVNFAEDWGSNETKTSSDLGDDVFITKIDIKGNYCWTHVIGSKDTDCPSAVCTDENGNVYVVGQFSDSIYPGIEFNFAEDWRDTDIKKCVGEADAFITSIKADGQYRWTHTIGGKGFDNALAVCANNNGSIYVTGYCQGNVVNFAADWNGKDEKKSMGESDIFVTQLNAEGSYNWTHTIGGPLDDAAFGISTDANGRIFLGGNFWGDIDFARDWGRIDQKSSKGDYDIFVTMLDADGDYVRTAKIGGQHLDFFGGLCIHAKNLYITGAFTDTVDFGKGWGVKDKKSGMRSDVFITKVSQP